jgi:methyl-accepting chemotaxis protein
MIGDKLSDEYTNFKESLELYKTNNKNKIIQLKASISIRQNRVADCNKKIMDIEIKAHEQKKIYTDALFKNTMIQSQYTMSLHAQNMNSMNIDRVLTQSSQRNTQRVLQNVKNTLDTQKTKSQLFANVIKAKNWDFTRRVQDINDKYDDKFNEQARLLRQQTLDRQREDNMRLIAENKARAERMAANIKANAAATASATEAAAAKTAAKMDKTAAKMDKTAAKLDTTSAKLGELANKIEEKGYETVDAIDAVADSAKEVVEALEKTGKALDDIIDRLKAAGVVIIDSMPSECISGSAPPCGSGWMKDAQFTTARNKSTKRKNIKIFRCVAGAHFCASDGESGGWYPHMRDHLYEMYDNIPYIDQ